MDRVEITKRTLTRKYGTEGPRHDPYSYTEWTVTTNLSTVTIHMGSNFWTEVNGKRYDHEDFYAGGPGDDSVIGWVDTITWLWILNQLANDKLLVGKVV